MPTANPAVAKLTITAIADADNEVAQAIPGRPLAAAPPERAAGSAWVSHSAPRTGDQRRRQQQGRGLERARRSSRRR